MKFQDLIVRFDGTEDFVDWCERFEDLAELHGLDKLETILPGLLSPNTYAVYKGLDAPVKRDFRLLKKALSEAFSLDSRLAYDQFSQRRLREGESVDVYLCDLKKWGKIVDPDLSDKFIKHAFLSGLPVSLKNYLRTNLPWSTATLNDVLCAARLKIQEERVERLGVGSACVGYEEQIPSNATKVDTTKRFGNQSQVRCFRCNNVGHVSRDCRVSWDKVESNRGNGRKSFERTCYRCGKPGHISSQCSRTSTTDTSKNE